MKRSLLDSFLARCLLCPVSMGRFVFLFPFVRVALATPSFAQSTLEESRYELRGRGGFAMGGNMGAWTLGLDTVYRVN